MSEQKSAQTAGQQKNGKMPHSLILENRRTLTATGVSNVDSFNDETVVAITDLGDLTVHGSNLHIDKLNLETGELTLDGDITSMTYTENRSSGGGVFSRLFK
ncbi:MAG: Sporulation protein YabP [Thermocaproicibacter melissae]|jgi:sporulation protein YabP|uniref:sporulation protein YabP n=1 Tax=Thermocaproicibacter melissae TaxID=2966552 RepID=UPI0024B14390|nr:sporulation protein YabP [Thermocaproicibacter melissae]WBY63445.1 sporulation protein YabP [Thermocaproicibacter melissae]